MIPDDPDNIVLGNLQKAFSDSSDSPWVCSFVTYGGTERVIDGIYVVENTAILEGWYNPNIQNNCQIKDPTGQVWEVTNVENIEMRNQFSRVKVKAYLGGA
jgi:hypothetical protein